jgi:hypothetical protein
MAKRDLCIDIHYPGGAVDQISVYADPDEGSDVRDALRAYLDNSGWDRGLWGKIRATWPRGWGRVGEVRAD